MALGWDISVYRQQNDGSAPASFGAAKGTILAHWSANLEGLRWLADLVKEQKAIKLGQTRWSFEYTAMATHVIPRLRDGRPPDAKSAAPDDPVASYKLSGEVVTYPDMYGRTRVDLEAMDACRPDEWLVIDAQDED